MNYRSLTLGAALAAAVWAGSIVSASAQSAIRIVVGVPPGGNLDALARLVADRLGPAIGSPVIVENRPGAGSAIANQYVKSAPNDGSTFLVAPISSMTIFPHSHNNVTYEPFRDFTPVIHLAKFKYALGVGASVPAQTLDDYVAILKKDQKFAMFGSAGAGSPTHFYGLLLGKAVGVEMMHIPFKGTSAVLTAVMSGDLPAAFVPFGDIANLAKAKKAQLLAIVDSDRSPDFPGTPTFKESGFDFDEGGQYLMYAPAGTPPEIVDRVAKIIKQALSDPKLVERLHSMYLEPTGYDAASVLTMTRKSFDAWGKIVRESGFAMEK